MEDAKIGRRKFKERSFLRQGLLFLFTLSALHFPLSAADWPVFRGNNARTGFTAEQAAPPLTKAWEYQAAADIISSPVIFEDMVYFGSRDNNVYALNARTGALIWQYSTGGWVDATPSAAGDALFVPSLDGYLYALNRLTGEMLWRAGLGASSVSSPLFLDGKVIVGAGSPEKKLKVFKVSTGELLFEYPANQPVDSAPSTDGTLVYFGANDGKIYALDKNTFSTAWSYQTMGGNYGMNAVAVSSGIVYALPGQDEKKPLAFNAGNGTLLNSLSGPFEENDSWEQVGSPVAAGSRVYFSGGAAANTFYAMDTGALDRGLAAQAPPYVWPSSPTLGAVSSIGILSSPAMADDIIYAGTVDGGLVAFTSAAVSVPLAADVSFSSPVYSSPGISNGMVFVATSGGKLIAYKAAKIAAISCPRTYDIVNGTVSVKGYVSNPDLTGYTLEYGVGEDPGSWHTLVSSSSVQAAENAVLAYWDATQLPNGFYTLRLTALENPAASFDNTALLTVRVNAVPFAPSGLTAADVPDDNGNKIRLNWTASASAGITAYRIYRDAGEGFVEIASVSSGSLTCIDADAVTGTTFTYAARAFDGYLESEDSNLAAASAVNDTGDNTPPARIDDLSAEPGYEAGTALLAWTAPGNDGNVGTASHYVIKYTSVPGHDWNNFDGADLHVSTLPVDGPAGDYQMQELGGLLGGVTYYFAVKTSDFASNLSQVSNVATSWATIDLVPPLPPEGLSTADTLGDDGGSLTLAWALSPDDGALAGDVYGYKIYRRLRNSVYLSTAPYAEVSKGVSGYTDNAATTNIRFYYSVAAFDSSNNSPLSNEAYGVSADNWRFFDASQGASVRLPDGARVDIPANAASQNDHLLFSKLDSVTYQPLFRVKANTQANPTGLVYGLRLKLETTKLSKPAVITLPYTEESVAGMNPENLRVYMLYGGTWRMVDRSTADTQAKKVSAEVIRFSTAAVMEYVPSGEFLNSDEVYTYPNPAKGAALSFKFRVSEKARVTVDVYNVAGEKVAEFEKANCAAGDTSEIVWSIENIASGVYIYRLKAESASGSKTVIKKLAVIH
jgi:outer membrane protein assembly factor BamB